SASIVPSPWLLDPASGAPILQQALRPGISFTPTVASSNSPSGSFAYSQGGTSGIFTAGAPGSTILSITQPDGFNAPLLRGTMKVVVNPANILASVPPFIGRDLQASFVPSFLSFSSTAKVPVTVSSSDPSRLLISSSAAIVGSGEIQTTTAVPVFLQGLASDGVVTVRISGVNIGESLYPVTLTSAGMAITASNYSQNPVPMTTVSQSQPFSASLFSVIPTLYSVTPSFSLRAGAPPVQAAITSSRPEVAAASVSSIAFAPGGTGSVSFNVAPLSEGDTVIGVTPPAAFHADPAREQVAVRVQLPSFDPASLSVMRDFVIGSYLQFSAGTLPTTIIVTLRSDDPSRVLLSTRPDQPGQTHISLAFGPSANNPTYYVHGISEGPATLTASGAGVADTVFYVTVATPALSLSVSNRAIVGVALEGSISFNGHVLRPGVQLSINLHSSDTTVATVASPVVVTPGSNRGVVQITPVAPGTAAISVDLPDGYSGNGQTLSIPLTVTLPPLQFSSFNQILNIGNNLQLPQNLLLMEQKPLDLTITSSDPSKVLISTDPKALGKGSVSATLPYYTQFPYYVQALADSGTVTLTFTAPGREPMLATVKLAPAVIFFNSGQLNTNKTTPAAFQLFMSTQSSLYPAQTLRGGLAPLNVTVSSSQPSVGTVKSPVAFNPGDIAASGTFIPAGSGATVLTIDLPPGFVPATSNNSLVVTVNQL
ncbi:MAG TPA: hypothetical protein VNH18_18690, partial [Bryobacteraceae bacterium]|nr:hypothetical protein [Bryobacteraceae bacterium]